MTVLRQRYERAEQLLPWNLARKLKNLSLIPRWVDNVRFWFKRDRKDLCAGYEFILVDTEQLSEIPVFDHQRLAEKLSELLGQIFSPDELPIENLVFETEQRLSITIGYVNGSQSIVLDLDTYYCALVSDSYPHTTSANLVPVISPDGQYEVIGRDYNLFLCDRSTGEGTRLTQDGCRHYGYGNYSDFTSISIFGGQPLPPAVLWSLDGRYLAVKRVDERHVKDMPLMQTVPQDNTVRPVNHPYKLALPGDTDVALASLIVIDLETGDIINCDRPPVPASGGGFFSLRALQWGSDNCVYYVEWTHDRRTVRLVRFDPVNCAARVLVEEQGEGYLHPGPIPYEPSIFKVLPKANEFIWYSHRSGWGHLYRYDLTTGALKNPVTTGDYVVTGIRHVDTDCGVLYFTACGREPGRNPYYEHLYRVNLDGGGLVLLTPEDGQHDVIPPSFLGPDYSVIPNVHGLSPDGKVFVDTVSRVDQLPTSVLRSGVDGTKLMLLSECDETCLSDSPYTPPLPFAVKAADGTTDLWGGIHRPSDFEEGQGYPVILAIYGGPQACVAPRRFADFSGQYVGLIARVLAELGFVVVTLDPRGTPMRSKAFQDVAFGNFQNGGGMDDQISALKQLGKRYSWMDLSRVGITGHSSGGYASAHALLRHPDFFQVAVSSAGAHDQSLYVAGWAEAFQGVFRGDNFMAQANKNNVAGFRGKLLLIQGDMDANTHIAQTMQLIDQLVKHNKIFDLVILPNRKHDYVQDRYFIRRVWDYFVEHLLHELPPEDYCFSS